MQLSHRLAAITACAVLTSTPVFADHWAHAGTPDAVGLSPDRLDRLTQVMQSYVDSGDVAGMVIMIAKDGEIAYETALGKMDLANDKPMQVDTIFRIASMTKAIVSAGAMILQEEGKLLVDDPVGKYLPEWMETVVAVDDGSGGFTTEPATRPITIRDLLTHTSGMPYGEWLSDKTSKVWADAGFDGWYFADDTKPIRELAREMAALPMESQPGMTWSYGLNIDVLGAVLEVASGQTLDVFLKDRILDPLMMTDTQFWLPADKADRLPVVYDRTGPGALVPAKDGAGMWTQGEYIVGQGPNVALSGGAGLLSTAHDYTTFLEMLRRGGVSVQGQRILSPMSVTLMTTDHLGAIPFPNNDGSGFGYGFRVSEDQGVIGTPGNDGEYSWGGAYNTTYWVDPVEDMVVTGWTQFGDTGGLDWQDKLRAMVYQAITD
jgi:CubicO group peptidase (beta-lactamase class C family)